jgi:hypothetical protein
MKHWWKCHQKQYVSDEESRRCQLNSWTKLCQDCFKKDQHAIPSKENKMFPKRIDVAAFAVDTFLAFTVSSEKE